MASLGEIDTELMVDNVIVRLVMKELQAEVYGGTTFHTDNSITADINAGEVIIHGKYTVKQFNPMRPVKRFLPSSLSLEDTPSNVRSRNPTIKIGASQVALPSESVQLKLPPELSDKSKIVINPRFNNKSNKNWPPQICDIVDGNAIYMNSSKSISISHFFFFLFFKF